MKRWMIAVFMLFVCSLTFPMTADPAPDEIGSNPNPAPIGTLLDWFGSLWHAAMDAVTPGPHSGGIRP